MGLSLFRGQKFASALVIRYGDKAGTFFAQGLGIGKQGEGFHLQSLDFAHKGSNFPGDVFAVEYAAGGNRAGAGKGHRMGRFDAENPAELL